jgi:hypothetical protein
MHPSFIYQYSQQLHSFVPDILPEDMLKLSPRNVTYILEKRYGHTFWKAMQYGENFPSPTSQNTDSQWIKEANMVGINVRTIGNFWNIVKYAMTLPSSQSSIHILPIWECGVVASLYGMASWNINTEFFSHELYVTFPHLDTVEKQLKVVVNILHLMGKTVGMDVIPHTDRYSEVVLANPFLFEWLQRKDLKITNHNADLHKKIEQKIIEFVHLNGSAAHHQDFIPELEKIFFSPQMPESERIRILFGDKDNLSGRTARRNQLIQMLYEEGYETVPATMGPPYRGIEVDSDENAKTVDKDGRIWRDYKITRPEAFSRVFGPLARYKLHESKDNNKNWELDFDQPRKNVFQYVASKYLEMTRLYGFDFMRGDMTHVQMRPDGVPKNVDEFYDIHKYIKNFIQKERPWFAYFAESFLAPDGVMAYGSEVEHLLQSDADTTLGDLQSAIVGSDEFLKNLKHYYDVLEKTTLSPNFTMMTADKDDPRFDSFYVKANELRYFTGIFIQNMPSYMGLGFECRDVHLSPAPNENYTKLYVFQIDEGEKSTKGAYQWGQNKSLFENIVRLRKLSEWLLPKIAGQKIIWIEPIGKGKILSWTFDQSPYVFVVNLDVENEAKYEQKGTIVFSTQKNTGKKNILRPAECVVWEF